MVQRDTFEATLTPGGQITAMRDHHHDGAVTLDVGGRIFKVLRQTIEARPSTLLACLLDDIGFEEDIPLFVDANPDRFGYILDWYRHGEVFLPQTISVQAFIRDARFFLLPDTLRINDTEHFIDAARDRPQEPAAEACGARASLLRSVVESWPGFEEYLDELLLDVREHFLSVGNESTQPSVVLACGGHALGHTDAASCTKESLADRAFPKKRLQLSERCCYDLPYYGKVEGHRWRDLDNVCNRQRCWAVIVELERRGFACELEGDVDSGLVLSVGLGLDWSAGEQASPGACRGGARTHGCLTLAV